MWFGMLVCMFGIVFYIFNEYMIYCFLFYIKLFKNIFLLKMLRRLYYDYYVYLDDLKFLFLFVWFSIFSFIIYLFIVYGIIKSVIIIFLFGIGMIIMLFVYEWKYYIVYRLICFVIKFGRWLKK